MRTVVAVHGEDGKCAAIVSCAGLGLENPGEADGPRLVQRTVRCKRTGQIERNTEIVVEAGLALSLPENDPRMAAAEGDFRHQWPAQRGLGVGAGGVIGQVVELVEDRAAEEGQPRSGMGIRSWRRRGLVQPEGKIASLDDAGKLLVIGVGQRPDRLEITDRSGLLDPVGSLSVVFRSGEPLHQRVIWLALRRLMIVDFNAAIAQVAGRLTDGAIERRPVKPAEHAKREKGGAHMPAPMFCSAPAASSAPAGWTGLAFPGVNLPIR